MTCLLCYNNHVHALNPNTKARKGLIHIIIYIKATVVSVCGDKQGRAGVGQGRATRADTCPLFSVTDRVGQGQGRAAKADTCPLFSITNRAGHII